MLRYVCVRIISEEEEDEEDNDPDEVEAVQGFYTLAAPPNGRNVCASLRHRLILGPVRLRVSQGVRHVRLTCSQSAHR